MKRPTRNLPAPQKPSATLARIGTWSILALAPLGIPANAAPYRQINGVCSIFDERGNAVMVTLDSSQLTLEISPPQGVETTLSLPFASSTTLNTAGCSIFLSEDDRFAAVEVKRSYPQASLHVFVANVADRKWLGNFEVTQDDVLGPPVSLAGFLPGTSSLLVLGVPPGADKPGMTVNAFSTEVLDVQGNRVSAPAYRALPPGTGSMLFADARHNRVWFHGAPDPCPVRSLPLVGKQGDGFAVGASLSRSLCYSGHPAVSPDDATYLTDLSPDVDNSEVWRIDLKQNSADHIDLPNVSHSGIRVDVEGNILSPDGQIAAILRDRRSYVVFGPRGNKEIDLVQVRPLKYLGKTNFPEFTDLYGFSIDHRNGSTTVLGFWDGKWQRRSIKYQ